MSKIALLGVGLIGGSIGLALHKLKTPPQVIGYSPNHKTTARALKLRAIDAEATTPEKAVTGASLVILCSPIQAIHELLEKIAPALSPGAIVTDVASTKQQVVQWAAELLPDSVSFVGGHPMAGKELTGIEAADATLFQGCTYCLTPTASSTEVALQTVMNLVQTLGANLLILDPAEHDGLVAGISHLPAVLAALLVRTASKTATWHDLSRLAAGGFRDTTRVASGSPIMHRDICLTNREAVVRWITQYISELEEFRSLVQAGDPGIEKVFVEARQVRDEWVAQRWPPADTKR